MDNRAMCFMKPVLWGLAMLLLLAAAFDIFPSVGDNLLIFLALACFVVLGVMKKIAKNSSCCK